VNHKPTKPFPNGSTYEYFNGAFCCRCSKLKLDDAGMPLSDNCPIENALAIGLDDCWPSNEIVEVPGADYYCLHFKSEEPLIMEQYHDLAKEGTE
jgi:hypothetical protein